ncbi:MAG: hypothetical protein R3E95_03585 [Thiolinea sp.]
MNRRDSVREQHASTAFEDRYTRNARNKARLADRISVIVARNKGHIAAVDVEKN